MSLSTVNSPILYSEEDHLYKHLNLIEDGSFNIQPNDSIVADLVGENERSSFWYNSIIEEFNFFNLSWVAVKLEFFSAIVYISLRVPVSKSW
jgi:hypothetical protein